MRIKSLVIAMLYLMLLSVGLGMVWWGLLVREEVVRLTALFLSAIFFIWGLALTPQSLLFVGEIIAVVAIFRICVRCYNCD